jgi:hypothetical protein
MKSPKNAFTLCFKVLSMKRKLRNVLILIVYFTILLLLLPLHYYNISAWPVIFSVICISIVWVLHEAFGRSPDKDTVHVVAGLAILYIGFHCLFKLSCFCAWRDFGTEYVSRTDKSDTLVLEGYSCFLTDTDAQLYEVRKITEHLKWVMPYYKKQIDETRWQPAPSAIAR